MAILENVYYFENSYKRGFPSPSGSLIDVLNQVKKENFQKFQLRPEPGTQEAQDPGGGEGSHVFDAGGHGFSNFVEIPFLYGSEGLSEKA